MLEADSDGNRQQRVVDRVAIRIFEIEIGSAQADRAERAPSGVTPRIVQQVDIPELVRATWQVRHGLQIRQVGLGKALASCLDPSNNACLPESLLRWTCTPHAEVGGDCFTDVNCNAGLFCDNPDLSISGSTCMTRKAIGAGCGLPNECDSLFCRQGQCVEATVDAAYCLSE
jgi:hypothetical protein